jgi:release factor glutamine methyltransferase
MEVFFYLWSMQDKTIKQGIEYIKQALDHYYPDKEIKAMINILMKSIIGMEHYKLFTSPDAKIDKSEWNRLKEAIFLLQHDHPLQYILSETEFYGMRFNVNAHALIPRVETEELVQWIIDEHQGEALDILEIGTGTGCIAITLKHHLPGARITATDFSEEALSLAKTNASLHDVSIHFIQHDIITEHMPDQKFDIVVSNPPYVRNCEKKYMSRNVLDHEPPTALFVPDDHPLLFYEAILTKTLNHLNPGGSVYFEINEAFGSELIELLRHYNLTNIMLKKDMNGKDRMIKGDGCVR